MKRVMMLGILLIAAAGCAEGGPKAPAAPMPVITDVSQIAAGPGTNHFTLSLSAGRGVDALVTDNAITAPGVALSRYADASDHAIRGDAFGRVLNIDTTASGAKGVYGGGPMNIEAKLEGPEIHVTGTVAGKITDFKIGPAGINGAVGHCMFQMSRNGNLYNGTRGCRSGSEPANLKLPDSFKTWSVAELSAAMVVLLSAGA
jgi:hypothetical protein